MTVDRAYVHANEAARERLRRLVERLTDAELARALPAGWTVAGALAHLAFWDQRTLWLVERWDQGERPRRLDEADVDWINEAAKPLCLALPPRLAARLAVETAERLDRRLAALSDARVAENQAAGGPLRLDRAQHRRTHLDEIEGALAR